MTRPRRELLAKVGRSFVPRASRFPLSVRRSPIHRVGVCALESIPARQRVIEYTGERISREEAVARWERSRTRGGPARCYLKRLRGEWLIDGSVGGSGAELVNHSCTPNLGTRRSRGRVFYFSRKPILAGEELTTDYRFPRKGEMVKCRCGSPKCRGTINRK